MGGQELNQEERMVKRSVDLGVEVRAGAGSGAVNSRRHQSACCHSLDPPVPSW